MTRSLTRALLRYSFVLAAILGFALYFGQVPASAAATPPPTQAGVVISNTASATYTDANGTAYTTNSNTVTTTVQNVPALTVTQTVPGTTQNVGVGNTVADQFTLTNTGNGPGNFQITTDSVSDSNFAGIVVNGGANIGGVTNPCTYATVPLCTLAQANAYLDLTTSVIATAGTVPIAIVYTADPTQTTFPDNTVQTLNATITSTAPTGTTAATATTTAATETDVVNTNARLDLTKVAGTYTGTNPIPFTIYGNNGGAFAATAATAPEALLGVATPGILVSDKIPLNGTTPLQLSGAATYAKISAGDTATAGTVYYSTSPTGAAGSWSTTLPANQTTTPVYYVAVLLTGGSLASNPAGSTITGTTPTVSAANAQFSVSLTLVQPTGGTTITNTANSVLDGNPNAAPVTGTPLIGPGIPIGTVDSPTSPLTAPLNNTNTPTTYNSTTGPGGASNTVTITSATASVLNGPNGVPGAVGLYPGATGTASNNGDFTAAGATCTGAVQTSSATPPVGPGTTSGTCTTTGSVVMPGTFQNSGTGGSGSDNFQIAVTAPAGYTAQVFECNGTGGATATAIAGVTCAQGTALTGVATSGATSTGTGAQIINVANGASVNYVVVYTADATATTVPAYAPLVSPVTVTGNSGAGTGTDTNTTNMVLYPGGVIELSKTAAVSCTAPYTAFSATTPVAPGCHIQYVVTYTNEASATFNTGTGANAEPANAYAALTVPAGMIITEDGGTATTASATTTGVGAIVGGNNWYQHSGGLVAAVTTTGATFTTTYFLNGVVPTPAVNPTNGTTTFPATTPSNVSQFQAKTTTTIAPAATGTITFSVAIN